MNHQLIERLAEYVEQMPGAFRFDPEHGVSVPLDPPDGADKSTVIYDQGVYIERGPCGTKCCIAGALALLQDEPLVIGAESMTVHAPDPYYSWTHYVCKTLEISFDQADMLTDTRIEDVEDRSPTPDQAAAAIRNLLRDESTDPWFGVCDLPR